MMTTWLDRIGDWNPQLVRELKGRLKPRNILLAIALSAIVQILLMWVFFSQLPTDSTHYSSYALRDDAYNPIIDPDTGLSMINWERWWEDIFRVLNWLLVFVLMVPGVFMLVTDVEHEERRGTLNFIRLSPQTASSILTGKIWGVLSLLYVAVLMVLPLHWLVAAQVKAPVGFLVSFYTITAVGSYLLFSLSLLIGFLAKFGPANLSGSMTSGAAVVSVVFAFVLYAPLFIVWNAGIVWFAFGDYLTGSSYPPNLQWFFIAIDGHPAIAHAFTLGNMGIAIFGVWQALKRCFHSPSDTILSKAQSYGMVAYCQVLMMGFFFNDYPDGSSSFSSILSFISVLQIVGFVVLIGLLSHQRQTLLDWARYRHVQASQSSDKVKRSLWWDLVVGEKSSATLALLINLLIAGAAMLVYILLEKPAEASLMRLLAGLVIMLNLPALYASIAQLTLMMRTPKRAAWTGGAIGFMIVLPLFLAALANTGWNSGALNRILLFTPFVWSAVSSASISAMTIGLTVLGQWLAIALLNMRFAAQLKAAGASSTQALLTASKG